MKTKEKGDIAVSQAISYYIRNGYEVCLPIGDKRHYDLVIEKDGIVKRVQVKYAGLSKKSNFKKCVVALRITGGNRSFNCAHKYSNKDFDFLFVYTEKKDCYHIPWNEMNCRNEITVESKKYRKYKVK